MMQNDPDASIAMHTFRLLNSRNADAGICPSEVAGAMYPAQMKFQWSHRL
jgi:hypothetical protein